MRNWLRDDEAYARKAFAVILFIFLLLAKPIALKAIGKLVIDARGSNSAISLSGIRHDIAK